MHSCSIFCILFSTNLVAVYVLPCSFLQNINDIRSCRKTKVPLFNLEIGARSGFRELEVSEDCAVVCWLFYMRNSYY